MGGGHGMDNFMWNRRWLFRMLQEMIYFMCYAKRVAKVIFQSLFLSLNIMSFIHFLLQVRTIKYDLDSIYEHDSLQQFCTGLNFFVITVRNVVVVR